MVDPHIFIDPAGLAVGPGYSIAVYSAIGNGFVGGAIPEPSTWTMMLVGFAGLGYAGNRSSRRNAVVGIWP